MSFKENLLQKIKIDRLAGKIRLTIGPAAGERRLDAALMRQLLAESPLEKKTVRDLELYLTDADTGLILVLDNELAFYKTSMDDVALRKSPTVKEMISIRNAIKILNDQDVIVDKKEASLERVHKMCLDRLDLSHTQADIASIAQEAAAALEMASVDGIIEHLDLLAELTGYQPPPKAFRIKGCHIIGQLASKPGGESKYGPLVLYDLAENTLKLIDRTASTRDKAARESIQEIASGEQEPTLEGQAVISFLEKLAIDRMPKVITKIS